MEKTQWSLNELYTGFESEKFNEDLKKFSAEVKSLKAWCSEELKDSTEAERKAEYYIVFLNKMGERASSLSEYTQLVMSTDAKNAQAAKIMSKIESNYADLTIPETMFEKWFAALKNKTEIIKGSKILTEHKYMLEEITEKSRYLLSDKEEEVIAKMRTTGSLSWMKLWELISSTLMCDVDIDMEKHILPIAEVRNMAYSHDEEVRKAAYEAEIKALKTIAPSSAAALNGIKGEVITTCALRGYKSPLDMTCMDSRIDKKVLVNMLSAMKEYQKEFRKYFRKKAEILGRKNGLPFYDLFAPMGESKMHFTYDEAMEFVIENFSLFSKDLGNFAKKAYKNRWIDVYPKEGKRGGAFCSNLHSIGESRILTNFTGSFSDVITLAHELGHGYHGEQLNKETYINSGYPMPIAETASTFCETLVKNAALKNASKKDALMILETDISDNAQIVVDILCRFLFEDEVFKRRKDGPLSDAELAEIMMECQKKTYGNGLNKNIMHPYMWVCKPHYYDVEYNYYNFPYAFGLLFAKGLYAVYEEKGRGFATDYKKLLSATGKNSLKDVALMAGIDITEKAFWIKSLDVIAGDIEKFVNM